MKILTITITIIIITLFTACSRTRVDVNADGKHIDYNIKMNIKNH